MRAVCGIDWLCINCIGSVRDNQRFKFKKLEYGTKQFRSVYEVCYCGSAFGVVCADPYLQSLPYSFVQIKLNNKLLYTEDISVCVHELLVFCSWTFHSISRIDVYMDFNSFEHGYLPENLIRDFVSGRVHSCTKTKFSVCGSCKRDISHEYLRLGCRGSDVVARLYNKSVEMRESVMKFYIKESWMLGGLNANEDVWRLEFELKGKSKCFANASSGSVLDVRNELEFKESFIMELLQLLSHRYFRFKRACADSNKSRWSDVKLLCFDAVKSVIVHGEVASNCGRSTRIFAVQLAKYQMSDMRGDGASIMGSKLLAVSWLERHQLLSYVEQRGYPIRL